MIPITFFRSSSFNAHSFCPQRFFLEYILGWRGPSNKKADKGTIVHKVMEILANSKKAQQDGLPYFIDDETKVEYSSDVMSLDIEVVTRNVYDYYTKLFTHHEWKPIDFKDCIKWSHASLKYLDHRKRKIVQAETPFDFELKYDWAKYRYDINGEILEGYLSLKGTIDLIMEVRPGFYEILDFKTGQRLNWATGQRKEYEDFQKDPQLKIYHLAASTIFDVDQVMATILYVRDGGPFSVCFENGEIVDTLKMIRKKFELIRDTELPELNKTWKCKKLCHFGKNTFQGTHVLPIVEERTNQVTPRGECMTMCEQTHYVHKHRDLNPIIKNMTASGHQIGFYKSPGSA